MPLYIDYNYHFNRLTSSTYIVFLSLNSARKMAKPIAASAAATLITKNTNTCPVALPKNDENDTSVRLTEFSIISRLINIIIAFLLVRTPIVPIVKSTAETIR